MQTNNTQTNNRVRVPLHSHTSLVSYHIGRRYDDRNMKWKCSLCNAMFGREKKKVKIMLVWALVCKYCTTLYRCAIERRASKRATKRVAECSAKQKKKNQQHWSIVQRQVEICVYSERVLFALCRAKKKKGRTSAFSLNCEEWENSCTEGNNRIKKKSKLIEKNNSTTTTASQSTSTTSLGNESRFHSLC